MSAIKIENLSIAYGDAVVFNNLNAEFKQGVCHVILGRSGIGKTVLLRALAGLADGHKTQSGHILIEQNHAQRCAYMAQQDLLLPWLNVLDNVQLSARLNRQANGETLARAQALLAQVGLADKARATVQTLSGGQRQRVALARTMMQKSAIVLMDEPFSALDAISRAQLQQLALTVFSGRTLILITHDPFEALRMGDVIHFLLPDKKGARLDAPIVLSGSTPRSFTAKKSAALYEQLLERLCAA